jgi:hypothetical protein
MSSPSLSSAPSRRDGLSFQNSDEIIADVQRLRRGYTQTGAWSLPAMCWHLETAIRLRMSPGPHPANTPAQDARREQFQQILATGQLPSGIEAPAPAIPPVNADDSSIDALITTIEKWKEYAGPIAPHRLFGNISDAEARRLNLIHCAHHLSYLVPTS